MWAAAPATGLLPVGQQRTTGLTGAGQRCRGVALAEATVPATAARTMVERSGTTRRAPTGPAQLQLSPAGRARAARAAAAPAAGPGARDAARAAALAGAEAAGAFRGFQAGDALQLESDAEVLLRLEREINEDAVSTAPASS